MTVHDEVVFEIRHDLVPVVIPIIIEIMESPTFLAKPAWKVPLVVEPLLGLAWDGKYDWAKMRLGRKAKPGESPKEGKEYAIEDRIYQSVPPWLNGILAFELRLRQLRVVARQPSPLGAIVRRLSHPSRNPRL
jgi:hypothetical protein